MTTPAVFTTDRLVARQIGPADAAALLAVYGDPEVVRWVGDGQPLTPELCEKWVKVTRRNVETRGYGMLALALRHPTDAQREVLVGFAGLVHPGGQPEAEIKYAFARPHWGRGYATEAARGLMDYGRRVLGLREVIATAAPQNLASHRVLRKAGLADDGLRHNDDGSVTQCFAWRAGDA